MENEDAAVLSLEKHLGCAMSGTTANLDCAANRAAPLFGDGHPTDTEQTVPQFSGSMQGVRGHRTFPYCTAQFLHFVALGSWRYSLKKSELSFIKRKIHT